MFTTEDLTKQLMAELVPLERAIREHKLGIAKTGNRSAELWKTPGFDQRRYTKEQLVKAINQFLTLKEREQEFKEYAKHAENHTENPWKRRKR